MQKMTACQINKDEYFESLLHIFNDQYQYYLKLILSKKI